MSEHTVSGARRRGLFEIAGELYLGDSDRARFFRLGMLVLDVIAVVFFVVTSIVRHDPWVIVIDILFALVFIADFAIRWWVRNDNRSFWWSWQTIADVVVILSLLAAAFAENLLFLRGLRVLRSYRVLAELQQRYPWLKRNAEVISSVINVAIFMFVTASVVFILQEGQNPKIVDFMDALYFTVTTLSTTGYGDITLVGKSGQLLAIIMMLVGISLFVRMLQTIVIARRVHYPCPDCGLSRHEVDAVHCKACGRMLAIQDEGVM